MEPLLEAIWTRYQFFTKIHFVRISRKNNEVADGIAKRARRQNISEIWVNPIPDWICSLVVSDRAKFVQVA